MQRELRATETDQESDSARKAIALLLETRTRPVLRAFVVVDPDADGFTVIATATRIHGRPIVYELAAPGCDPVLLESLLLQHGQTTH
jgi:hypothetical protein